MTRFGSLLLSDDDFLAAFESCRLSTDEFHHADHLRLAWIYLHRMPFEEALEKVRAGIQAFAHHHGVPHLYHETITRGWVHLLHSHPETAFEQFWEANKSRLGKELLHQYWSEALLNGSEARAGWVEPDLRVLPG